MMSNQNNLERNTLDYEMLSKEIDKYSIMPYGGESFGQFITRIMKTQNIKQSDLFGRTGVPKPTISRYLRDKEDNMNQNYVIAIVMGLQLTSTQTRAALCLAGVSIDYPSKRNIIIQYCLDRCSLTKAERRTIADCNLLLLHNNLPVLTNKILDEVELLPGDKYKTSYWND